MPVLVTLLNRTAQRAAAMRRPLQSASFSFAYNQSVAMGRAVRMIARGVVWRGVWEQWPERRSATLSRVQKKVRPPILTQKTLAACHPKPN